MIHDFSVWLLTGSDSRDNYQFQSHTVKTYSFITKLSSTLYELNILREG